VSGDSVKDVKGVTYRTDVDTGQGGLLIHWEEEEEEEGEDSRAGENGRITDQPSFLNEFRVFIQDWSALRLMKRKRKRG